MASLTFFAIVALYMIRVCLYISMTLMVRPIAATNDTNFVDEFACPAALDERLSTTTHHNQSSLMAGQDGSVQQNLHQLDWDQEKQGLIFSSFYMGYTVMQLPVGIIVERAGGKPIILISLYFSALLSILTPVAIAWGDAPALFAVRFLLGCLQAGIFSTASRLLATWIPAGERGFIGGLLNCGGPVWAIDWFCAGSISDGFVKILFLVYRLQFGTVMGNFAAGLLMHHFKSWTVNFYVFGVIAIVAGILYVCVCCLAYATILRTKEMNYWIRCCCL